MSLIYFLHTFIVREKNCILEALNILCLGITITLRLQSLSDLGLKFIPIHDLTISTQKHVTSPVSLERVNILFYQGSRQMKT